MFRKKGTLTFEITITVPINIFYSKFFKTTIYIQKHNNLFLGKHGYIFVKYKYITTTLIFFFYH